MTTPTVRVLRTRESGAITTTLVAHEGWEQAGACRGVDPSLFFGPNRFEPKRERLAREDAAKAICATCPVVEPCRDAAVRLGESFGVWGGTGEVERRALLEAAEGYSKAG